MLVRELEAVLSSSGKRAGCRLAGCGSQKSFHSLNGGSGFLDVREGKKRQARD
jgi:hypothetical protein